MDINVTARFRYKEDENAFVYHMGSGNRLILEIKFRYNNKWIKKHTYILVERDFISRRNFFEAIEAAIEDVEEVEDIVNRMVKGHIKEANREADFLEKRKDNKVREKQMKKKLRGKGKMSFTVKVGVDEQPRG